MVWAVLKNVRCYQCVENVMSIQPIEYCAPNIRFRTPQITTIRRRYVPNLYFYSQNIYFIWFVVKLTWRISLRSSLLQRHCKWVTEVSCWWGGAVIQKLEFLFAGDIHVGFRKYIITYIIFIFIWNCPTLADSFADDEHIYDFAMYTGALINYFWSHGTIYFNTYSEDAGNQFGSWKLCKCDEIDLWFAGNSQFSVYKG